MEGRFLRVFGSQNPSLPLKEVLTGSQSTQDLPFPQIKGSPYEYIKSGLAVGIF